MYEDAGYLLNRLQLEYVGDLLLQSSKEDFLKSYKNLETLE